MTIKTFEAHGLKFVLHVPEVWIDSYTIAKPEITQSGNWEVWSIEAEGATEAKTIDEVEFVPEHRLIEIISDETLSYEIVNLLIASFLIGEEYGEAGALVRHQKMVRYAIESLTGEIPDLELESAAVSHYDRIEREVERR